MTAIDEVKRAWLTLRLVAGMNRSRFYTLLERFKTPEGALGAPARELAALRGFDETLARTVLDAPRTAPVDRELELMARHGAHLLTEDDAGYPENFRLSFFPPPLLFVRGSLQPNDRYAISLVGSRNSTTYGRMVSREFATRFAVCGMTVVSGFARGVDAAAHQGALAGGGRTLAVLGNGLAVCYPAEHRALGERIAGDGGALISEYPMQTPPDRYNFPERNRLIATLSLGTVVVEAAERSGSLITAREALEENRFVFAVPGDVTRLNARGANRLIQSGARLVQRADDALLEMKDLLRGFLREEMLEEDKGEERKGRPRRGAPEARKTSIAAEEPDLFPDRSSDGAEKEIAVPAAIAVPPRSRPALTPEETLVYNLIRHEPQYLDSLAACLDPERLPVPRLSAVLLSLELKQAIRQMPGRLYVAFE